MSSPTDKLAAITREGVTSLANCFNKPATFAAEALHLERTLSDLVNQAYGLTPEEIALLWDTAPPRMPIPRPEP